MNRTIISAAFACIVASTYGAGIYTAEIGGYTYHYDVYSASWTAGIGRDLSQQSWRLAVDPEPSGALAIPATLPYEYRIDSSNTLIVACNVVRLYPRSFSFLRDLTSVSIPDTVADIDSEAFRLCTSLESVLLPSALRSVGGSAFSECRLLGEATFPLGTTNIGWHAYSQCFALSNVVFNSGLVQIGGSAFWSCTNLTSIVLPTSLKTIGEYAFSSCTSLESVHIGGGDVGGYAFSGCDRLSELTLGDNVTSIGHDAFRGCTNLTSVMIPDSVTNIDYCAFYGCSRLTNVTISANSRLKRIGREAFLECKGLEGIHIPSQVSFIGSNAFAGCERLEYIEVPDSVKTIGDCAFAGCTGLRKAKLGSGLETLGNSAFGAYRLANTFSSQPCISLERVEIQSGAIGKDAFYRCTNLVEALLGPNVTRIGYRAFGDCNKLFSADLPDSIVEIADEAFNNTRLTRVHIPVGVTNLSANAFAYTDITELVIPGNVKQVDRAFQQCYSLTNVVVEAGVEVLDYAFYSCVDLQYISLPVGLKNIRSAFGYCRALKKVCVPNSVTHMEGAFIGCSGLTRVNIPNAITDIGYETFAYCSSLAEITIPECVTNIGSRAFATCSGLVKMVFAGDEPAIAYNALGGANYWDCVVYIPRGNTTYTLDSDGKWNNRIVKYYGPGTNGKGTFKERGDGYIVTANDGESLSLGDFSFDVDSAAYKIDIAPDCKSAVVALNPPLMGLSLIDDQELPQDPDDDKSGQLADIGYIYAKYGYDALKSVPQTEGDESVGALPVKTYAGLWYQAAWGDDIGNMKSGEKVQATGDTLYLGVIKQTGNRGFYMISVSER